MNSVDIAPLTIELKFDTDSDVGNYSHVAWERVTAPSPMSLRCSRASAVYSEVSTYAIYEPNLLYASVCPDLKKRGIKLWARQFLLHVTGRG